MTQSVQVNPKLPDLGAPFLYGSQEEAEQAGSYSVQTPYGFQLDLDFLKYVEEIESGHSFRRTPVSSRRGGGGPRAPKLSQRSPGVGGRASGWTSTESLSSSASDDGSGRGAIPPPPPPRSRIGSLPASVPAASSEPHVISPLPVFSPPPLSAGAATKVPPPPPTRNPRVERTLMETSLRLQQEQQSQIHLQQLQQSQLQNGTVVFQLADPPRGPGWTPSSSTQSATATPIAAAVLPPPQSSSSVPASSDAPAHLHPSQSPCPSVWTRPSPHTSGRSTPATGAALASLSASTPGGSSSAMVPPLHLQTVREQMAAALRQLKEMEERVKGVPALEREVAQLRAEREALLQALREEKQKQASSSEKQSGETSSASPSSSSPVTTTLAAVTITTASTATMTTSTPTATATAAVQTVSSEPVVVASPQEPGPLSPSAGRTNKVSELRKAIEKASKEEAAGNGSSKQQAEKVAPPAVQTVSVAVGGDQPLSSGVFYYREAMKDAAVDAWTQDNNECVAVVGTETQSQVSQSQSQVSSGCEMGVQVAPSSAEASVEVTEALLGLKNEAEERESESAALQETVRLQQESIAALEERLGRANGDLEALRAREQERQARVTLERGVQVQAQTASVGTDAPPAPPAKTMNSVGVSCRPEVAEVGVGGEEKRTPATCHQSIQTEEEEEEEREKGKEEVKKEVVEVEKVAMVDTASQWENPEGEEDEEKEKEKEKEAEKEARPGLKRRQVTMAEVVSGIEAERRTGDEVATPPAVPSPVGTLKSIMKRKDGSSSGENRSTGKKSLQFVGILNGGYESTSSEEEEDDDDDEEDEDDDDDDGSSSDDAGECSSSGEEEAAQQETSDEERNINLDESDSDDAVETGSSPGQQEVVKEKFELSMKMREACLIMKNHLNDDTKAKAKSKEVLSSTHTVQLEWFRVSSAKTAQPARVSNYLMAFSEVSPVLLEHVVNMTDGNGNTALHYSVSHSNFTVVGLLLDTGVCCVDQQNKAGYTAIMLAALSAVKEEDDMEVVKKLFSQGNVNAKASQAGQTALMLAVSHGRHEMVRALLECGASVNVQDDEGSTALMCASEHGRAEIVALLLEQADCDISVVDNDGSNALSIALEASHNDIAVLLYAHMNYSKTQAAGMNKGANRSPTSPQKPWPAE
ncbi:KN motif and ankyrin repeat domain-containing protein 3 isoform X2 [Engraulis encrasicolus]|uniref:KN motif and ankyrin repeat domain-containing protein 3 isoform X2 n=1 Tax=Engraulis encrasicolus TaxID=184585 RepID=UPI002FD754C5